MYVVVFAQNLQLEVFCPNHQTLFSMPRSYGHVARFPLRGAVTPTPVANPERSYKEFLLSGEKLQTELKHSRKRVQELEESLNHANEHAKYALVQKTCVNESNYN